MKNKINKIIKKITNKIPTPIKNFFTKDVKMKLLVAYLVANLIYILVGSYIFMTGKISTDFHYKEFSLGLRKFLEYNVIVFLVIVFEKRYKRNWVHLGILLIAIFACISTYFAFDKKIALEGCWGRYEGLFSVLYYLSVMLLSTFVSDKYKKFLVNCILICGAFQAFYGVCQCFNWLHVKQFGKPYKVYDEAVHATVFKSKPWILGLTNNPNFFGTYMLLCISYSIGLFMDSKKVIKSVYYALLTALFMFGLLASNTTSAVVGLIFVCIIVLIKAIKNKLIVKWFVLLMIFVSMIVLAVNLDKTTLLNDVVTTGTEATEIAKGNLDDSYGTKRMYIWKRTVEIVPKHIWHGVGVDSFHKAFDGKALIRKTKTKAIIYDKAHNEYLQLLITQGIFSLIAYLSLCGYVLFCGLHRSIKHNELYLVLPVIGYLVQAFFNISVIEVAPIFWLAMGLCCGKKE